MKDFEKGRLQKALLLLPVSLLMMTRVVSPATAALKVSDFVESSAQSLVLAKAPHAYSDWEHRWAENEAAIRR